MLLIRNQNQNKKLYFDYGLMLCLLHINEIKCKWAHTKLGTQLLI